MSELAKNTAEISKYADHKKICEANSSLLAKVLPKKRAYSVSHCGDYLFFDVYKNLNDPSVFKRVLAGGMFCHHRFCIMCSYKKSLKLQREVLATINHYENAQKQKFAYLFLTLTVPNCKMTELRDVSKKMSYAFSKVTKIEKWRKSVKGYVRAIEFIGDHTKEGEAHPHFHLLLVVEQLVYFKPSNYITFAEWRELWSHAYGVNDLIIRVEKIKAKTLDNGKVISDKVSAVLECLKYSVDLTDLKKLGQEDLRNLIDQTRGIKQCNRGGILLNLFDEQIDLAEWEWLSQEGYRWFNHQYSLLHQKLDEEIV